jgi:hypothetical protein
VDCRFGEKSGRVVRAIHPHAHRCAMIWQTIDSFRKAIPNLTSSISVLPTLIDYTRDVDVYFFRGSFWYLKRYAEQPDSVVNQLLERFLIRHEFSSVCGPLYHKTIIKTTAHLGKPLFLFVFYFIFINFLFPTWIRFPD